MPQFDAAGIVEALNCKLTPFADFDGEIKEPSDQQIGQFLASLRKTITEARQRLGARQDVDVSDSAQVAKAMEEMDPDEFERTAGTMAGLFAALCSGRPSQEQILAVPPRRRVLFYAWLQSEVLNPEAAPGGGNAQVMRLPSRAAG